MWEFPGGKVEPGETPRAALRREVREELHIAIEVGRLLGHGAGRVGPHREILLDVYAATWVSGELELTEHHELGWFAPSELAHLDWPEADIAILPAVAAYTASLAPDTDNA